MKKENNNVTVTVIQPHREKSFEAINIPTTCFEIRKEQNRKEKKKFIFRIATDIYLTEGKTCTSSIIHGPYNNVERLNPYAIERNACHRKNVCYGVFSFTLSLSFYLCRSSYRCLMNLVDMIIIASLSERVNECVKKSGSGRTKKKERNESYT